MRRPVISVSNNLIVVPDNLYGYEMVISSEEGIIYSTTVTSNILPITLSEGHYQIRFISELYTFYGEFELSEEDGD